MTEPKPAPGLARAPHGLSVGRLLRAIVWIAMGTAGCRLRGGEADILSIALAGGVFWLYYWIRSSARGQDRPPAAVRRECLVIALLLALCGLPELAQLLFGSGLAATAPGRLHVAASVATIPLVLATTLKQSPTTYTLVAQAAWHLVLGLPALAAGVARLTFAPRGSAWDARLLGDSINLQVIRDILPLAMGAVLALVTLGAWVQEYLRRDHAMSPAWSALFATQTALGLLILRGTLPLVGSG